VVPWLNSSVAPFDFVEMAGFQVNGKGPKIGDILYLDGAAGLPAGNYAILPAHYALLQGAYLVTPKATDWQAGQSARQLDGTAWVSGRYGRAFSSSYDSQWLGFAVEPGSVARTRSQYNETTGDEFFAAEDTSAHAADAGRVVISVSDTLDLLGNIIGAAAQNGRKAQLDIIANEIEVVNTHDANSGAVQLSVAGLNGLGVDSILLGGRRSGNGREAAIAVGANNVAVQSGAKLEVPDIMLVAHDNITLQQGSIVAATGNSTANTQLFHIDGDGAFLRASSAAQADVARTNTTHPALAGVLTIAAGASVNADQAVLLDATRDMVLDGTIGLKSRTDGVVTSLNLTANRISLGDSSNAATDGIKFSNAKLNSFNAQALRLSSRSGIDFYGDVLLNNQRVELNTGALRNMQSGAAKISAANTLQLDNTIGATDIDSGQSSGTLVLAAKNIELGNNRDPLGKLQNDTAPQHMDLFGFSRTEIGARGLTSQLNGQGNFALQGAGDIDVIADRIQGSNGATTAITATGDGAINLLAANAPADSATTSTTARLGAKLDITGSKVTQGTHIDLPSGILTLTATGAAVDDNVSLLAGSVTDVSGRTIAFPQGSVVQSDGGEVHLHAGSGDVVADASAKVVLGGSGDFDSITLRKADANTKNKVTLGGNSGLLDIVASGKALWRASIQALAASDAKGGNLQLDVGSFAAGDFSGWLQRIANSGVDQRINIRSRSGDLTIDNNIRAADLTVSADAGNVALAATINARGGDGGHVALWGGNNLTLSDNANILASATANGGRGGKVALGARDGELVFGANSAIDIAGRAGAIGQDTGRNGQLLLRAPRIASNDDVAVANNGLTVKGAERIELEAFKSYDASSDGSVSSQWSAALSDATDFMTNQAAIKARLGGFAGASELHLLPGIDIFSTGDLMLDAMPNLNTARFGTVANVFEGEAGVLSLRAANNLTIASDLRDGTVANTSNNAILKTTASTLLMQDYAWNYRIVAGADLNAADPTATQNNTGNLVVSDGKDIITGAGWIDLYAGGLLSVDDANSVIAILGRTDYASYKNPRKAVANRPDNELLPDTGSIDPYYLTSGAQRYPMYPQDGGDLSIGTGGDVKFAQTTSFFSDWMQRIANNALPLGNKTVAQNLPVKNFDITTWGVVQDKLTQGIAVLGGGNMQVRAGGSVSNLNAALPVTAKQIGNDVNQVSIIGGGNLDVIAGGDILSPRIWVDRGRADLQANGRIGANAGDLGALLVLADTQVDIKARGDVEIGAVLNSTVMPSSRTAVAPAQVSALENYFFTYSDNAKVTTSSLQGDVILENNTQAVVNTFSTLWGNGFGLNSSVPDQAIFAIYPGQLSATALNRNVRIEHDMTLFPSPQGQLVLLAGDSIGTADIAKADTVKVNLSDADPNGLPSLYKPAKKIADSATDNAVIRLLGAINRASNPNLHAAIPLHVNDITPVIIAALNGDIGAAGNLIFELAKPVRAYAGRDISNTTFAVEHSNASQISEFIAGRDILFPLQVDTEHGTFAQATDHFIRVDGPGRLDVIAGRDVDLGASAGIDAAGNTNNPALPNQGAGVNVLAGINGPSALSDPVLYSQFADRYLSGGSGLTGTYINWFTNAGLSVFSPDKTSITVANLVSVFTGKKYADNNVALTDFRTLPLLTQQAISLSAYQTFSGAQNYAAPLISFVSLESFGGDLTAAVQSATGQSYAGNAQAAAAMALLPAAQQQQIARSALDAASTTVRRELLLSVYSSEVRAGGVQQANAKAAQQVLAPSEGYGRAYAAINEMFPGKSWQGDINLALSVVRTFGDGDINVMAPGGEVNVGLPNKIAGFNKDAKDLGIIANGYGEINGIASGSFNINQSRVFSLGNGDITLLSTLGDVDAGKGAKTALSVAPPTVVFSSDGSAKLIYPTAVAGSGIQAGGPNNGATDRGPLLLADDESVPVGSDTRSARLRYLKSLSKGNVYL
ncbi:MAG TPA: filamentous hemagglutinin family protein, partial [Spongiibacteraceae bacterium]|nr:filamentous hemagglutinin family protein [Spongiibacteraceae bacterium]